MTNKQWAIWQMIDMSEHDMAKFITRLYECNFRVGRPVPNYYKDGYKKCEEWLKQEHEE